MDAREMANPLRLDHIKVHLAVDVKTNQIVAIEVTDERVSDGSKINSLIDQS
jgi:hypothetical protein